MIAGALKRQVQGGEFNYIDAHFADMLARLAQTTGTRASPALIPWFARLSHALTRQHSCLDLSSLPESDELIAELTSLSIVGSPADTNFPLILDGTRLYMQRYFQYESRIANALAERNRLLDDIDVAQAIEITRSRFPETGWQQVAALQALTRQLSIITGGPGTGKTTTVVRIIRAIVELAGEEIPAIRLAAPTGKAAMRLMEALREQNLPVDLEVQTLHRLLGMRADGRSYRHGPEFPVTADLLIVDEVSMIDLAMMHRLVGALRADARVILLGDPGQLPSVEAGNILADICKHPAGYTSAFADIAQQVGMVLPITDSGHRLADAICELKQSYRFLPDKGIGRLSHAIRAGDNITIEDDEEVTFTSLAAFGADQQVAVYEHYIDTLAATRDPLTRLATFEQNRILSPVREGPHGVVAINAAIESTLMDRGLIDLHEPYYPGRPILVTRNDYNLALFNGDIGICLPDETTGEPMVMFRDTEGEPRSYLVSRLPPHETCYAMTVHKSQGSEFDHVVLMVPTPSTAAGWQLMTRELIYTAVTRARHKVTLCYEGDVLRQCLANRNARFSGLGDRLLA